MDNFNQFLKIYAVTIMAIVIGVIVFVSLKPSDEQKAQALLDRAEEQVIMAEVLQGNSEEILSEAHRIIESCDVK